MRLRSSAPERWSSRSFLMFVHACSATAATSVRSAQPQRTVPVTANAAATPTATDAALAVSDAHRTVSFHMPSRRPSSDRSPARSPASAPKSRIEGGRPATISPNTRCFMKRGVTRTNASRSVCPTESRYCTMDDVRIVACFARSRSAASRTTSARPVTSISQLARLLARRRLVQQERDLGPRAHLADLGVGLHRREVEQRTRGLVVGQERAGVHHAHAHLLARVRADGDASRGQQGLADAATRLVEGRGSRCGGYGGTGLGHSDGLRVSC